MHQSLVRVLFLLAKQVLVSADDGLGTQFHMEVFLLVGVLEANSIVSSRVDWLSRVTTDDVDLLVNFLTLLKDVFALLVESRLKARQDLNHEVGVLSVCPLIVLGEALLILEALWLGEDKVDLELFKEVLEEEVLEDVALDVVRQLAHQCRILLRRNRIVLVVLPVVAEVFFNFCGHLGRQRLVLIKMLEDK